MRKSEDIFQLESSSDIQSWHDFFDSFISQSQCKNLQIYLDESFKGKSISKYTIYYPAIFDSKSKELVIRFLVTEINNIVALLGTSQIGLNGELAEEVKKKMEDEFGYLLELINDFFGNNSPIATKPITKPSHASTLTLSIPAVTKPRLGIDIGGTSINIALVDDHKIIQTIEFPSIKSEETFSQFLERLNSTIIATKWKKKFYGIGIAWFGDVANDNALLNADILQKRFEEKDLINRFPKTISQKHNVPVFIWGDIEVLGYYYAKKMNLKNTWILRIGTSIGGAYIDNNYRFDPGLHQVGRVITHMERGAFRHTSTKIPGMSQQYVTSHTLRRLLDQASFEYQTFGGPGEKLQSMLSSKTEEKVAKKIIQEFAEELAILITELSKHTLTSSIILSGSPITGMLGEETLTSLNFELKKRRLEINTVKDMLPAKYAGSFAAAELLAFS